MFPGEENFMRNLFLALFLLSLSNLSFAISGPATPSSGGDGRPECRTYDKGWEEHGYHDTCHECLAQHSECVEKCFTYTYTCKASGEVRERYLDSNGNQIERVRVLTFQAVEGRELFARRTALDYCYNQAVNCEIISCSEDSSLDRVRSCRR